MAKMMILQIRTFSIKRVLSKIGKVNQNSFEEIIEKAKNILTPPL